eukprot:TRINITY_DN68085_c0_g1_i1.p1 TRINITY_DN68085_c0_g1~~TRINITY_DN68085_c0_g1_i1.p1  ORF type:complete len:1144 (+),score=135.40 TRINITY_DN68085_c0_g1_i1:66-3497(+)
MEVLVQFSIRVVGYRMTAACRRNALSGPSRALREAASPISSRFCSINQRLGHSRAVPDTKIFCGHGGGASFSASVGSRPWMVRLADSCADASAAVRSKAKSPRSQSLSPGGRVSQCTVYRSLTLPIGYRPKRGRCAVRMGERSLATIDAASSGDCRALIAGETASNIKAVEEESPPVWSADRVRQTYLDFFMHRKRHTFIPASPVVPLNDPTLLFVNAGMNQFKAVFMDQLERTSPLQGVCRAVNSQKCIRAGGKHNDLDDVGRDVYHHTFFEMLGNWSFGDYFKREAIDWAWELLTDVYGLDPNNIYASYFGGDNHMGLQPDLEAKALWERHLPASRILAFGKDDNFWEMGAVGPCGPCSELHYDRIGGRDASKLVNSDDPDVIEIWNLVFMQFYRNKDGNLTELPNQHIDTGMGLERILSVLQNKRSNYDTDLFAPLLAAVHDVVGGEPYLGRVGDADIGLRDTAFRVIVDHARTLTLSLADGALPSNEGRGYVLRRILRRGVRFSRQMLNAPPGLFCRLVPVVVTSLSAAFPELIAAQERIRTVLWEEEATFDRTVERGMRSFSDLSSHLCASGEKVVPGDVAFRLYDSHGFPLDLTQQMAEECGLSVDIEGFEVALERQRERSRFALNEQQALQRGFAPWELQAEHSARFRSLRVGPTDDAQKYEWNITPTCTVRAIFTKAGFVDCTSLLTDAAGATVEVVLDKTPFYSEAGGQVSDVGQLVCTTNDFTAPFVPLLQIKDVQSFAGIVVHQGVLMSDVNDESSEPRRLSVGKVVRCHVDYERRRRVASNHTITHVLNWALREVIGGGAEQRGSLVSEERFRFDFTANTISNVQLARLEALVKGIIADSLPVTTRQAPLHTALSVAGVRALGGEDYPDPVRVVTIGEASAEQVLASPAHDHWLAQSVEFCGGTHIVETSDAEDFVILEEKAISRGVRRIVAATGHVAQIAIKEGDRVMMRLAELESSNLIDQIAIQDLGREVNTLSISAALKSDCRGRLDSLWKRLRKGQKADGKARAQDAQASLARLVAQSIERRELQCVACVDGLDKKALQQVTQNMPGGIAWLVFAVDGSSLNCVAAVPEGSRTACHTANAWVCAALQPLGGRGGGKPCRAQGSAKISVGDIEAVQLAVHAAKAYWS